MSKMPRGRGLSRVRCLDDDTNTLIQMGKRMPEIYATLRPRGHTAMVN